MVAQPPNMLPRNVTTPKAEIGQRLIALLDAVDEPISIASAIRDREGRIIDFRIEYVSEATARWANVPRVPYPAADALVADEITGGSWVGGIYDMRAIRLGDGYISTWRLQTPTPKPST